MVIAISGVILELVRFEGIKTESCIFIQINLNFACMKSNQISIIFILVSVFALSGCTTVPVNVVEWAPKAEPSIRFKGDVGGIAFNVWIVAYVPFGGQFYLSLLLVK